jgi:hypothetical protein
MSCILFVAVALCASPIHAQTDSAGAWRGILTERLLERGADDGENPVLFEELDALARRPLNLATATLEELSALPFLTPSEALALQQRRDAGGGFADWDAVMSTSGIDEDAFIFLRLYTYLPREPDRGAWRRISLRSRFQQDDRSSAGFLDGRYPGSRWKSSQRLQAQCSERIKAGILAAKDPGESSWIDRLGGYCEADSLGPIDRIVVGDFTVSAGQGLVLWKPAGLSKGGDAVRSGIRASPLLQASLSSSSTSALRGVGVQAHLGGARGAVFVSRRSLDGGIDSATGAVGSLGASGLHRTATEQSSRGTVSEFAAGAHADAQWSAGETRISLGCTAAFSRLDRAIASPSPHVFTGADAHAYSVDATLRHPSFAASSEWGRSHTGATGGMASVSTRPSRHIACTVLYRRYAPDFSSRFGYAFGEMNGATRNEEGLYFGLRCTPVRGAVIQAAYDMYRFPGCSTTMPVPSSGHEFMTDLEWAAARGFTVGVRYGQQTKDDIVAATDRDGRDIRPVTQATRRTVRLETAYDAGSLRLRFRVETVLLSRAAFVPPERGMLMFADLQWVPSAPVLFSVRVASYRADSWDSRVTMVEQDIGGMMAINGCSGEGLRLSVAARCALGRSVTIGAQYSETIAPGAPSSGTGADEIAGDALGRMTFQTDIAF